MLKGIAASTGVAIAELFYLREPDLTVAPDMECDPVAERARYNAEMCIRDRYRLYSKKHWTPLAIMGLILVLAAALTAIGYIPVIGAYV